MRAQAWLLIFSLPAEIIFGMFPDQIPPQLSMLSTLKQFVIRTLWARFLLQRMSVIKNC